jgi:hypothetical protein
VTRVLRLADLTGAQRALVTALLAQRRPNEKAAPAIVTPGAAAEARRDRDERPPAA